MIESTPTITELIEQIAQQLVDEGRECDEQVIASIATAITSRILFCADEYKRRKVNQKWRHSN